MVSIIVPILVVANLLVPLPLYAQQIIEFERSSLQIKTKSKRVHEFSVELAESSEQKTRGLMFRQEMGANEGMLFLHKRDRVLTMWMANTFLPLDMLFIEADGRIARIEKDTIPQSREIVSSRQRVRAVLEFNAGTAQKLGIAVGDRVIYEGFK